MTAAMHQQWPDDDDDHADPPAESASQPAVHLAPLPDIVEIYIPPSRLPGWAALAVFPIAVAITVLAIGGWRQTSADPISGPVARVEVRDASGTMTAAGAVSDRLERAGVAVSSLSRSVIATDTTEIRFEGPHGMEAAKVVRQALGTGSIVRWGSNGGQTEITILLGKDIGKDVLDE